MKYYDMIIQLDVSILSKVVIQCDTQSQYTSLRAGCYKSTVTGLTGIDPDLQTPGITDTQKNKTLGASTLLSCTPI